MKNFPLFSSARRKFFTFYTIEYGKREREWKTMIKIDKFPLVDTPSDDFQFSRKLFFWRSAVSLKTFPLLSEIKKTIRRNFLLSHFARVTNLLSQMHFPQGFAFTFHVTAKFSHFSFDIKMKILSSDLNHFSFNINFLKQQTSSYFFIFLDFLAIINLMSKSSLAIVILI